MIRILLYTYIKIYWIYPTPFWKKCVHMFTSESEYFFTAWMQEFHTNELTETNVTYVSDTHVCTTHKSWAARIKIAPLLFGSVFFSLFFGWVLMKIKIVWSLHMIIYPYETIRAGCDFLFTMYYIYIFIYINDTQFYCFGNGHSSGFWSPRLKRINQRPSNPMCFLLIAFLSMILFCLISSYRRCRIARREASYSLYQIRYIRRERILFLLSTFSYPRLLDCSSVHFYSIYTHR